MQDDFLDFSEDISDVDTFFRVQKSIFDSARAQAELADTEKEYFQAEDNALSRHREDQRDPRHAETIQAHQRVSWNKRGADTYAKLLAQKCEEVLGEVSVQPWVRSTRPPIRSSRGTLSSGQMRGTDAVPNCR